jgi:hypothetical protein
LRTRFDFPSRFKSATREGDVNITCTTFIMHSKSFVDDIEEKIPKENACSRDPCDNIIGAMKSSCQSIGENDFECLCIELYEWNDEINVCVASKCVA